MSGEYIRLEAAIKSTWMILEGIGYPRSENRSLERTVEAVFKSAPAANVNPVVHAHWYVDNGCAYCSNCRNNFKKTILKEAKYCPKCGAQIDGYGGHPDAGPPTPYDLLYEEGGANTT